MSMYQSNPERVYIWLDEDGERCSPRHRKLSAAIQFLKTPDERWIWISENGQPKLVKINKGDFPSQKPPVKLVVGEWVIRDLSPEEAEKVEQVKKLKAEGYL